MDGAARDFLILLAAIAVILGYALSYGIERRDAFDNECKEKGGTPILTRNEKICIAAKLIPIKANQ